MKTDTMKTDTTKTNTTKTNTTKTSKTRVRISAEGAPGPATRYRAEVELISEDEDGGTFAEVDLAREAETAGAAGAAVLSALKEMSELAARRFASLGMIVPMPFEQVVGSGPRQERLLGADRALIRAADDFAKADGEGARAEKVALGRLREAAAAFGEVWSAAKPRSCAPKPDAELDRLMGAARRYAGIATTSPTHHDESINNLCEAAEAWARRDAAEKESAS